MYTNLLLMVIYAPRVCYKQQVLMHYRQQSTNVGTSQRRPVVPFCVIAYLTGYSKLN